jgi:polysaccharide biosynthesis transport protein
MERTYSLPEMFAALKRRKWLAAAVTAVVLGLSMAAILALPRQYLARTVVQMEPQRLYPDFFPAQQVYSFEDRMRTVKHGILARPVLEQAIRQTGLYPDLEGDMDRAVERLRRNIEVRLEGEVAGGPPALLFVVEVKTDDPRKSALIAEMLPRHYSEMTRGVLQQQARALRETLDAQVAQLRDEMGGHEEKLLAFKRAHALELPETVETNIRAAARIETLLELRVGAIAEAQRRRTAVVAGFPEPASDAGRVLAIADDVRRRLDHARSAYGDGHPEVKRLQREWEETRERRDQELERHRAERVDGHLARIDQEIEEHRGEARRLEKDLALYQARMEAAPKWGEELRGLSRDYEALRVKLTSTLSRAVDAAAAETLITADSSPLFRVLEAPVAPSRPFAPNRTRLALVALLASIAAGLAAAGLAEFLDSSLRGPEDASAFGVPVLASIPRIGPRTTSKTA